MDAGPIATGGERGLPGGGAERVRLRATWPQRLLMLVPVGAVAVEELVDRNTGNTGAAGVLPSLSWSQAPSLLPPLALFAVAAVLYCWYGISLTPEAAVVHRLRRRTIPWSRVAAVQTEDFNLRGRRVVLYEVDGRRTPLRMPSTAFLAWDRKFDAKAEAIEAWWRCCSAG